MTGDLSQSHRIECPHCGGRVKLPANAAAETFLCPKCGLAIVVTTDGVATRQTGAQYASKSDEDLFEPPESRTSNEAQTGSENASPRSNASDLAHAHRLVQCSRCGDNFYLRPPFAEGPVECPDCSFLSLSEPMPDTQTEDQSDPLQQHDPFADTTMASLLEESHLDELQKSLVSDEPEQTPAVQVEEKEFNLAEELMAKAESEVADGSHSRPELPRRPFIDGVLNFLADPSALFVALLLTLGGNTMTSIFLKVLKLSSAQDISQVLAISFILLLIIIGLPTMFVAFVSLWAIAHDSAAGANKIEGWPDINITVWMSEARYIIVGLAVAAAPGYLLAQTLYLAGTPLWVSVATTLSILLLPFPVVILSMLYSGSAFLPFSGVVWRSFETSKTAWIRFYLLSLGLAGVSALAVWHMVSVSFFPRLFSTALLIATLMIYFRLLGRLGWIIEEQTDLDPHDPTEASS